MTEISEKIISLLKQFEWVSGEQIAGTLQISRTAVWKHIQQLKKKGYKIIAKPHEGYHLQKPIKTITVEEISHQLQTKFIGQKLVHLPSVSSTNNYAKTLAKENESEGTIILSDIQLKGRGRKQRSWVSPKNGLWFSIILRPNIPPTDAMKITMCAACALTEAIKQKTNLNPSIKWPNDILINNKKACGILTELSAEIDTINYLIIGIGLNTNNQLPGDLRGLATSLKIELKEEVNNLSLFIQILESFEHFYTELINQNDEMIRTTWISSSSTIGSNILVKTEKGDIKGKAIGLGKHGELLLQTPQGEEKIITGDISYL
jgi:BirA family biotin operon repressor/biotin-[acetyl-CoA-carboxylase] ligase